MVRFEFRPFSLDFKFPAGTSRGVLHHKLTYFIRISDPASPAKTGFGEVPFFKGQSLESQEEVENQLSALSRLSSFDEIMTYPACSCVKFGLEMACADLAGHGRCLYFPSPFTARESYVEINGLIWMGDFKLMHCRIEEKLAEGFSCIKIKIGAVNWNDELDLIRFIRARAGDSVTVRVDANGAFSPEEAPEKLEELARLGVHSIEQPIRQGQWETMRHLCATSPVPIALDEELIGIPIGESRDQMLDFIKPQFIILKPALCYGFSGASDWIARAVKRNIGWWVTSALESSVGLNAIAQFTGALNPGIPQGLGTGNLYTNNLPSPLRLDGDRLFYAGPEDAYRSHLQNFFK